MEKKVFSKTTETPKQYDENSKWKPRISTKNKPYFSKRYKGKWLNAGMIENKKKSIYKVWVSFDSVLMDNDIELNYFMTDKDELENDMFEKVEKFIDSYLYEKTRQQMINTHTNKEEKN